jgi:hypothetical protein
MMSYEQKVKLINKFMETYPMEEICGYWIGEDNEDNDKVDFVSVYLVFDSEKMKGKLNNAVEVNRKKNRLKSDIENLFGFHTYVGSYAKKCEDDVVINESMPLKFRRRLSLEGMIDDVDSLIYEWDACQYSSVGNFISDACDALKDNYIYDFLMDDDVTPKENDNLYYALVDMFGEYLSKVYYNKCGDKRTPKIREQKENKMKKVITLTESELVDLIKKIVSEDIDDEFEDNIEMDGDDEIQDFGFDYEEDDDEGALEKMKNRKMFKPSPVQHGRSEWKKEWETPYNPIKPSDLPLDKYLMSKNLKK